MYIKAEIREDNYNPIETVEFRGKNAVINLIKHLTRKYTSFEYRFFR